MISAHLKPQVTRLINPVVKLAVRVGITANGVTIVGAIGTMASAFYFYPRGDLLIGTLAICFFALSDLFDGAIARLTKVTRNSKRYSKKSQHILLRLAMP